MFVNEFENSNHYRLGQLLSTLKNVYGINLVLENKSASQLEKLHESGVARQQRIKENSAFNSWMNNPEYTKTVLVLEAVKIYLAEIAPKRRPKSRSTVNEGSDLSTMVHGPITSSDSSGRRKKRKHTRIKEASGRDMRSNYSASSIGSMGNDDLAHAQTLLAAQDISDRLQRMAEQVAKMSVEDLMPLVDVMKRQFGMEAAQGFNSVVKQALDDLLNKTTTVKDNVDNAVFALQQGITPQMSNDIESAEAPQFKSSKGDQEDMGLDAADMDLPDDHDTDQDHDEDHDDGFETTMPASGEKNEPLGRKKKPVQERARHPRRRF